MARRSRPVLANLFLHYALDMLDGPEVPGGCPLERYADDGVVHCKSRTQAEIEARSPRGWRGVYVQPGQDADRLPDEGFDFLGSTSADTAQAADQASKRPADGSGSSAPSTSLRGPSLGVITRLTRSSGAGPPTTGHRYPPRSSASSTTTCGGSRPSGPASATRTSRIHRSFTGISASSTRPGRTGGCSATASGASCTIRLDQHRPAPDRQARTSPTTLRCRYWAWRRHKRPCRSTAPPALPAQDGRCAICRSC